MQIGMNKGGWGLQGGWGDSRGWRCSARRIDIKGRGVFGWGCTLVGVANYRGAGSAILMKTALLKS